MSISTALTPKKRLSYFSPEASMMSLGNFWFFKYIFDIKIKLLIRVV